MSSADLSFVLVVASICATVVLWRFVDVLGAWLRRRGDRD